MLPIGLNMCTPGDQELISLAKTRYLLVRQLLCDHGHTLNISLWDKSRTLLMLNVSLFIFLLLCNRETQTKRSKIISGRICTFEKGWETPYHDCVVIFPSQNCMYCISLRFFATHSQSEDPAVRWQLNLYKDVAMRSDGPPDPDRVVDRIQRISAAVFNLEQVRIKHTYTPKYVMSCKVHYSVRYICIGWFTPTLTPVFIALHKKLRLYFTVTYCEIEKHSILELSWAFS